jgi:hypothetical protein
MPNITRRLAAVSTAAAVAALVLPGEASAGTTAGSVRTAISISMPASGPYGSLASIRGVLGRAGTGTYVGGQRLILQRATHGHRNWTSVKATQTWENGAYHFGIVLGRQFDYRVVYPGSRVYASSVSAVRWPLVTQKVTFRAAEGGVWGGFIVAEGTRYPHDSRRWPVFLQRYDATANAWRNIGFQQAGTDGRFSILANVPGGPAYYLIWAPAYGGYGAGVSPVVRHTTYSPRGTFVRPLLAKGGTNQPTFAPYPPARDPRRRLAAAYAAKGGTAWADVNVAGCKYLTVDLYGVDGSGGQTRVSVLAGSRVLYTEDIGPGWFPVVPEGILVLGRTSVRVQVSDLSTTNGPRAVLQLDSYCPTR